jgi:hypothetical protein
MSVWFSIYVGESLEPDTILNFILLVFVIVVFNVSCNSLFWGFWGFWYFCLLLFLTILSSTIEKLSPKPWSKFSLKILTYNNSQMLVGFKIQFHFEIMDTCFPLLYTCSMYSIIWKKFNLLSEIQVKQGSTPFDLLAWLLCERGKIQSDIYLVLSESKVKCYAPHIFLQVVIQLHFLIEVHKARQTWHFIFSNSHIVNSQNE